MMQPTLCADALGQNGRISYRRDVPDDLSKRIRQGRKKLGLNQAEFGARLNVNQTTVSRWESGAVPDVIMLAKVADLIGVDLAALAYADLEAGKAGPQLFIKGEVAAGVWREAVEWDRECWEPYQGGSHFDVSPDLRFGLRVAGDSMNQVYPPGTILDCVATTMRAADEYQTGQRVIVVRKRVDGEFEATVKEFYRDGDEEIWLVPRSSNPAFQQPIRLRDGGPDIEATWIMAIVKGSYRPE